MPSLPIAARLILLWALLINLAAVMAMGLDKAKAKAKGWRIPEKRLFLLAVLGGALGGILGMQVFRHKTQHASFRLGFPALLVVNLALYGGLVYFLCLR